MKEISHSIFCEPEGLIACVPGDPSSSYFDRKGLESFIFSMRARGEDTQRLEEQHQLIACAESNLTITE